jgi:hypothetical protein
MSNTFNIKRTETNGDGVALNSVAHPRPTSKIDVIIDALSVAQNSAWSALNQEALAYAVELKTELAKPEMAMSPEYLPQYIATNNIKPTTEGGGGAGGNMNPIKQLKAVLCDPTGKCCIDGSDEDRAIIDRALQALAQLEQEPESHIVKWSIPVDPNNFGEPLAQPEPQVCCNDYEKCIKPCTPRGRWLAEKEFTKEEQLSPVGIGVDVTPEGTHVVAVYRRSDAVEEMFYSQFHPLAKIKQSNYSDIVSDGGLDPRNKFDAPPRKEWVGLTDHDIELTFLTSGFTAKNFAHAIEAKLKEKNNAHT